MREVGCRLLERKFDLIVCLFTFAQLRLATLMSWVILRFILEWLSTVRRNSNNIAMEKFRKLKIEYSILIYSIFYFSDYRMKISLQKRRYS